MGLIFRARPFSTLAPTAVLVYGAALLAQSPVSPVNLDVVKARYTKHEHYVPMRDGVKLFTAVYVPKAMVDKPPAVPLPLLLLRTPYSISPYGADQYRSFVGPSPAFSDGTYIVVYQDVRGRWMSEGTFEHVRPHNPKKGARDTDESTDTYDTIDWLLKNVPHHNGRVGMWGISYPGFYVAAGMIDAHPALKAASPQAPVADWFTSDDWHHNGAFLLAHAFGWFSRNGWTFTRPTTVYPGPTVDRGTEDGYDFYLRLGSMKRITDTYFQDRMPFWTEMMRNDQRTPFWTARNIRPHLNRITPAVMTVGGWFDAENLFGALETYRAVEAQSPGTTNLLVMGPWVHGGWAGGTGDSLGDVRFDAKTAEFYREHIEQRFFDALLKEGLPAATLDLPEAYMFETGTNQWRRFDAWPPKQTDERALYLQGGGGLSFDAPAADAARSDYDEYVSDPNRPVPFTPGITPGMAVRYMVDDQRFAARRPDVLVYQTAPLPSDVTVAGPLVPSLHVSTSGTDADWIVKLIDVYPDRFPDEKGNVVNTLGGYQQLVRGDVMRGKFRRSLETPEPFTPGQPTLVEFTVPDTFHTFRRGHRIMVQIQSTWFPLIDRNPQKFMKINDADEGDFQKATQRVYRSSAQASHVKVRVLSTRSSR